MTGYVTLLTLFLLFFGLSFYFAVREWRHPRDNAPLPVDVEYVRVENYFGISFRSKMQEWLQTARPVEPSEPWKLPLRALLLKKNGEKILVLSGGTFGSPEQHDELVYCEGDLSVPELSVFSREIYACGNIETGAGTQLQAVAADGELVLGCDNEVSRWVDGYRKVLLRRGTVVHSRASSMESVELEPQVSAQSLYAPRIFTSGYEPRSAAAAAQHAVDIPSHSRGEDSTDILNGKAVIRLSADTALVQGDLDLGPATHVTESLVVNGILRTERDCSFDGSVNADAIELGCGNRVGGNLVSKGSLHVGEFSLIRENVIAQTDIVLSTGVRVGDVDRAAVVSAGREIRIGRNVLICGKAAAGRAIITT